MDLFGTKLVTLLSCEPGLGDALTWEGTFGLRCAICVSGHKNIDNELVESSCMWNERINVDFSDTLKSKKNIAEAFYSARLIMKKKHPDPFYWGGFIFQGDISTSIWRFG
jgi:CHAT domain-containing protein